jgi:hypothetical protein
VSLQFNTSTRELTIDRKMLMDLPVKARNPFTLALLDPAVVSRYTSEKNPFFMWSSSQMDVGGNTSTKNDLVLDGAPIQVGPKGSYAPPMDAVQEFSIQQNSVDAEFGHSAGGTMSVSMKSGTNDIHGTGYYFGRNPSLNAVVNPITRTPNFVRNHIWGGTVGGPIKKNKLFSFFTYEGWRTKEPRDAIRTMPTDLERIGNFSQSLNRNGSLRTIFDPSTTILVWPPIPHRARRSGQHHSHSRIDPTSAHHVRLLGPQQPGRRPEPFEQLQGLYLADEERLSPTRPTGTSATNSKCSALCIPHHARSGQLHPEYPRAMPNDNGGIMNSRTSPAIPSTRCRLRDHQLPWQLPC